MAIKKSQIYSSLWASGDALRGGMDASQYKNYILTLLFMKYVSDKSKNDPAAIVRVPDGGGFDDIAQHKGKPDIGDKINKVIRTLAEANELTGVIDQADFNDSGMLGSGKEMQDKLTKLVSIFENLNLGANRASGDDILGDAYEYFMMKFAVQSGKSKGQFYTPAEVSRVMAKVIGIGANTELNDTIYDPTCGSGSLLIRAADEAPTGITIYGQEMDNATWALARMNMFLHDQPTAEVKHGNTLASPAFTTDGGLKRFDFAVANPPFSSKEWTAGVNPSDDPYGRFEYGVPPPRNGDYAFLLHLISSLNSTGKGAIILPHGVLFRGNKEAAIRRNLVRRGFIKGIIGLPANLFYGTGIPACILVTDKENARARNGIFMIDASKGFIKDGNKNRLRERDIHKIVDTFNNLRELPGYSRMVSRSEIEDPANDYNLNIPRYIDSVEPEDLHDLDAHINGGIPDRDIDALGDYWAVFPTLRRELFETNGRLGYSDSRVPVEQVKTVILEHSEFAAYRASGAAIFDSWYESHALRLRAANEGANPQDLILVLSEDILKRFGELPLLDAYDIYQRLMDYWNDVMQDDAYLVAFNGWAIGRQLRAPDSGESADFTIGSGKSAVKYVSDLIPTALIIARFFAGERRELDALQAEEDRLRGEKEEIEEAHAVEGGALDELDGTKGITKGNVQQRVMELKQLVLDTYPEDSLEHKQVKVIGKNTFGERDWNKGVEDVDRIFAELDVLYEWLQAEAKISECRKTCSAKLNALYKSVRTKYTTLTDDEIKTLVVDDKWFADIRAAVDGEIQRVTQRLADRAQTLEARYANPLPELEQSVYEVSSRVERHIREMGVAYGYK